MGRQQHKQQQANRTHGKSALHSNNFQYGSVARNIKCTRRTAITFLTMNQVVSYDRYAFVYSKLLFTFANIQCKFSYFIYITSAGNFIKLLITIDPLIAFFPIISDHALKSKHIYNTCIRGLRGSVNVLIKGRSTSYNILFTYNRAVIIQNHYKYLQYYYIWRIVLYELLLYLSGIFHLKL